MDGKKKKRGGMLIAKPDYKKAYVTLRSPLSISSDVYPIRMIEEDKKNMAKPSKKSSILEDGEPKTPHWLDEKKDRANRFRPERFGSSHGGCGSDGDSAGGAAAKFPWSSMKSFSW
ncbi:hypothetical protein ACH5RR_012395 [Cinchona calisaya]|uniref:Uncharacterized protein n=1 Tax=Cinchona calisaya TaxID=153742 RepID=A0ABD3A7P9_9GENT